MCLFIFFWDNSYDEWYRPTSNKIAAHCSKIWTLGKRLWVGHRTDVFDTYPKQNKYLPCTVIEEDRHNILIHYASHSSHWDEWLPRSLAGLHRTAIEAKRKVGTRMTTIAYRKYTTQAVGKATAKGVQAPWTLRHLHDSRKISNY